MFGAFARFEFPDFRLTEAELTSQLPAIDRCQAVLPTTDLDAAWQAYVQQSQQEENRR